MQHSVSVPGHEGPPYGNYRGSYFGVIEQRVDPARLGRLRVRVHGVHSNNIPTEHLPWAWPRSVGASQESGVFFIPPLGEQVAIHFEKGDYEYPVWSGGWWGHGQTAQGQKNSKHRDWPTTNFGGDVWPSDHILRMERIAGVRKEDQPNNYTIISPLQKHLEMDDRRNKQKIKLADWQDNFYYLNSERGVTTIEAVEGVAKPNQRKPRGVTFSSNAGAMEAMQIYTAAHWYITIDDLKEVLDINTPGNHRIVVNDKDDRIEVWTSSGHHIVLDEKEQRIVARTQQGRALVLNDGARSWSLHNPSRGSYITYSDIARHMEIRSEGTTAIKSLGDTNISSGGRVNIDGLAGVFLNSDYYDVGAVAIPGMVYQKPANLEYEHPVTKEVSRKVPRAPDYPDQKPPPIEERKGIPPSQGPSTNV